jgi:low temperature requirement protein LtrA
MGVLLLLFVWWVWSFKTGFLCNRALAVLQLALDQVGLKVAHTHLLLPP